MTMLSIIQGLHAAAPEQCLLQAQGRCAFAYEAPRIAKQTRCFRAGHTNGFTQQQTRCKYLRAELLGLLLDEAIRVLAKRQCAVQMTIVWKFVHRNSSGSQFLWVKGNANHCRQQHSKRRCSDLDHALLEIALRLKRLPRLA